MKLRTYPEAYRHIVGFENEANADPSRLRAAMEVAERSRLAKEAGFRVFAWRPGPGTPAAGRVTGYGPYWEFDPELTAGWLDHPYKLRSSDGRTIFVSEPYGLSPSAITNLNRLQESGWSVDVRPERALHYPGRTIAIWITRKAA